MKTILSMLVLAMMFNTAQAAGPKAPVAAPARGAVVDPVRADGKVEIPAEPRAKIRFLEEKIQARNSPEVTENLARNLENRNNNAELVDIKMAMTFIEKALEKILKVEVDAASGKQKGRNYLIPVEKEALSTYQEWMSMFKEGEKVSQISENLGDSLVSGYAKELTTILREAIDEAKRSGRSISEVTREKLGNKVTDEELRLCKRAI